MSNEISTEYAFFDGDNVGPTIEILLIENKIAEATKLSENIKDALDSVEGLLEQNKDIDILIIGGDDILIRYSNAQSRKELLFDIASIFKSRTGLSMSCGVGKNIIEAIQNLRLAKLYGKDQIRGSV